MKGSEQIEVIVASDFPIVRSGLAFTLRHLSSLRVNTIEVASLDDLHACIDSHTPDIVMATPTLSASFDPAKLRSNDSLRRMKIMSIEVVTLPRSSQALYDGTISIADDVAAIEAKVASLVNSELKKEDERESLSQRETEIVSLVVKGLTNKEIADRLFLSVHTVITHRRNIARKLEIHSATGLTIYAIVNGIVKLDDVKL